MLKSFLYVAETISTPLVSQNYMSKIGITDDYPRREKELRQHRRDFEMVAIFCFRDTRIPAILERWVVKNFSHSLVSGQEFFDAPASDIIGDIVMRIPAKEPDYVRVL